MAVNIGKYLRVLTSNWNYAKPPERSKTSSFCRIQMHGPSFMQRHLPLWISIHVQRAIAVLVTGLAIGLPLLHFLPQTYNWMIRRRLFYWYAELRALESSFEAITSHKQLLDKQAEIERIEHDLSKIRFPLTFSDQVYNLRHHIDLVRRKIASRLGSLGRVAA